MTRRERIVQFIREFWAEHGYAPTTREIAAGAGYSTTSGVVYALLKMRHEGLVAFEDGKARTVRVL